MRPSTVTAELRSARHIFYRLKGKSRPNSGTRGDGGRKTHTVQAVIDAHLEVALKLHGLGEEMTE